MKYENLHTAQLICKEIEGLQSMVDQMSYSLEVVIQKQYQREFIHIVTIGETKSPLEEITKTYLRDCVIVFKAKIDELKKELEKL